MVNKFFSLGRSFAGSLSATAGSLLGYSDEHKKFLSSDFKCPNCGHLSKMGYLTLDWFSADGRKLPTWRGYFDSAYFAECRKCHYRWKIKNNHETQPIKKKLEVSGVIETDRSEEILGVDRRLIDNSKSSSKLTRKFSISKEWSKVYSIEYEKAQVDGTEINIGVSDAVSVKTSAEESIRRHYSISRETKETYLEEVEVEVPGFTKLSLVFQWKQIWQHGFVCLRRQVNEIKIPFQVIVSVTFDQLQLEEKS